MVVPKTERIYFTRGLDQVSRASLRSFKNRLKNILKVKSDAALSRHANGINRTPYMIAVKIGNEFAKYGIMNWMGSSKRGPKKNNL